LYDATILTELTNYERYLSCLVVAGVNYLKNALEVGVADFQATDIGDFIGQYPLVDEFRFQFIKENVIGEITLDTESVFECQDDDFPFEPPPSPEPPVLPPGKDEPVDSDDPSPDGTVNPPYDYGDDDDRTFVPGTTTNPGCWKTFTTYSSGSPSSTTDYTLGLSTDVPQLILVPGDNAWRLVDSITGRTMRTNWVGSYITPSLLSAEWQPVCETNDIFGIAP